MADRLALGERLAGLTDRFRDDGPVTVERLQPADIEPTAVVLAEAFRTETFTTVALGGNSDAIQSAFATFLAARLRAYHEYSQPVFVARDGDTIVGVVMLFRPGFSLPSRTVARLFIEARHELPTVLRTATLRDAYRVLAAHEPPAGIKERRYELEYIGVRPDRQGEGIGRYLLDTVHAFTDRDPAAEGVYLATAEAWSREFYASAGYETVETIPVEDVHSDEGPFTAYHMCRPAER
jgi:GNAT superfamily N-acetyltransferase